MHVSSGHHERLTTSVGLGVILVVSVVMGLVELQHIREMSSSFGIAAFALLPFLIDLGLIGAVGLLWYSRFDGVELLRIAGWVLFGMLVVGLLALWTITHQNIRGRPFAHTAFVTVNNMSVGGLIGFTFGWYDAFRRRHRAEVETERARLEFLHSSLRHNVLNGLSVILGRAELLADTVTDAGSDHLAEIHTRGEELQRFTEATNALLDNFLGYSADERGPRDLDEIIAEEVAKARAQYNDATFSIDIPDGVTVEADDLAGELFGNLLSNAVVHNDSDHPEVAVSARTVGDRVRVQVADNGPGIPDDRKDRVTEWNVKGVDSPGSGLGLAIANTLANRYDGTLDLADNEPAGTVVTVELPTAERPDRAPAQTAVAT